MEDSVQRLAIADVQSRAQNAQRNVEKLYAETSVAVLTKDEVEASVARQYDAECEARAQRKVELEQKHYPTVNPPKMDEDELHDMADRLCTKAVKNKSKLLEELDAKWMEEAMKRINVTRGKRWAEPERRLVV